MANKLYAMEQLTEEVAKDVAASPQEWMRFLNTASKLYKYTFPEQLLIYAQRPEATAVASMEIWNQKMYRWIKKGSKGIALISALAFSNLPWIPPFTSAFSAAFSFSRRASLRSAFSITAVFLSQN